MKLIKALAASVAMAIAGAAAADSTGVSDDEIKIGGAHDLSGIFAPFSVPAVKAAQLYFDEVNANGGVHGRKINYIVEDHGYQVPKAVQAGNKLINRDEVFAMLLSLGTPHNIAIFQLMGPKSIPNVNPLSAARQMIDPPAKWKFAGTASYYDAVKASARYMVESGETKKFCNMILPTDFGKEIEAGVVDASADLGIEVGPTISHKPDETDFTGALGKVKDAGCDTVGMALGIGQIINAIATANKLGMDTKFLLSSAGFHTVVAKGLAAQGVMDNVYAGAGWQDIEARVADTPELADWVGKWKEATGEDLPGTGALLGRSGAELMVRALEAAGPDLTREGFIAALEGLSFADPIMGNTVGMSADDHVAAKEVFISKVENGSWKLVETLE